MNIEISAEDVQIFFVAAKLRPQASGDHIPSLILRQTILFGLRAQAWLRRVWNNVYQRVCVNNARFRLDFPDGFDACDGGSDELGFQFIAAPPSEGIEDTDFTAGPRDE